MDDAHPISRSKTIFTQYSTTIDLGVSLLSGGLVTLFPVIGMSDHLSKSEIGFATLLNTTFLLIGNKFGKTAEREFTFYRIGITLGALAGSFFATLYLGPLLEVGLSSHAVLFIGATHLVVKGGAYVVYAFALRVMNPSSRRQPPPPSKPVKDPEPQGQQALLDLPVSTKAISELTKEALDQFHDWFQTEEGKGKWRSFDRLYKLAFLSQFWHNKNPIKDYEINSSEIHPPEFNTYKDILWLHVGSKVYSQLDRERLQILHRLFDNNQPAWDRCTKAEKLSFITQFSVQGIPIDTYVDEFGFCDEIWSNFGDISKLLDQTGIKVIHNFLKTRKGNEKWKTISPSLQLHLLSTFHKENLPCTLFLNLERLNNEDIKNYPDFIWVICNSQDNTRLDRDRFKIEVTSLFERCFTLDYPPPSHKILVPYQTFDLSKLEKFFTFEIDNCISKGTLTKNQLSWLGAIGLSNRVSSVFNKLSPQNHDELIKKLKSQFGMFYSLNQ